MEKNITITMLSEENKYTKEVLGTFENSRISYKEEDISNIIDLEKSLIIRENDEYLLTINLEKSDMTYYLKSHDKTLYMKINVLESINNSSCFKIKYYLEDNKDNIIDFKIEF